MHSHNHFNQCYTRSCWTANPTHHAIFPCKLPSSQANRVRRSRHAANSSPQAPSCCCQSLPLDRSLGLAQTRLNEASEPFPLLLDPYAPALCTHASLSSSRRGPGFSPAASSPPLQQQPLEQQGEHHGPQQQQGEQQQQLPFLLRHQQQHPRQQSQSSQDIIATKYIDDTLNVAMASTSLNTINKGDYQQVVLLGDGLDTRPFRMLWPKGTMFFLVAPADAHKHADAILKEQGAKVPSGCLLRRVSADLARVQGDGDPVFLPQLERAGFQGKNLSVWAIQGLDGYSLSMSSIHSLLSEVASAAAYHSLLVGELPAMSYQEAEHMLAEVGLLSTVLPFGTEATSYGRWSNRAAEQYGTPATVSHQPEFSSSYPSSSSSGASNDPSDDSAANSLPVARQRWLFTSQQMRLSTAQMDLYSEHLAVAEEVDEDFTGHFS